MYIRKLSREKHKFSNTCHVYDEKYVSQQLYFKYCLTPLKLFNAYRKTIEKLLKYRNYIAK